MEFSKTVKRVSAVLLLATLVCPLYACSKKPAAEPEKTDIVYRFTGDEADRPGYAEGEIEYTPDVMPEAGIYSVYFGNENGILPDYYPIAEEQIAEGDTGLKIQIGENILIPLEADRIIIMSENGENRTTEVEIPQGKRLKGKTETVFASVSDIHLNYPAGEKYWLNALNEYERLGAEYILIAGDVSEDGSEYPQFVETTRQSDYTGLIFNCRGNHEQTVAGMRYVRASTIYDGSTKIWIKLPEAPEYFEKEYKGDLNVRVFDESTESKKADYYYVTVNDNMIFFMDQMLENTSNSSKQDNFSEKQMQLLEDTLKKYSGTHQTGSEFDYETYNLFIVEHALIRNFSSGDLYDGPYSQPILMKEEYPNVMKFVSLLKEYPEAVWMSGHTHMGFGTSVDFIDRQYDDSGDPCGEPMARSVHNSSLSQPRWFEDGTVVYPNTFQNASEGYLCYQYEDDIVYEAHCFKEYTEDRAEYDENLFCDKILPVSTFIFPEEVKEH